MAQEFVGLAVVHALNSVALQLRPQQSHVPVIVGLTGSAVFLVHSQIAQELVATKTGPCAEPME